MTDIQTRIADRARAEWPGERVTGDGIEHVFPPVRKGGKTDAIIEHVARIAAKEAWDPQADVAAFHRAFGHPVGDAPALLENGRMRSRLEWIDEEMHELWSAHLAGDIVEVADAIGDAIYLLVGTAVEAGIPLREVFGAIQNANMAKLDASGKPIYRGDGKIMKPEGWEAPQVEIGAVITAAIGASE